VVRIHYLPRRSEGISVCRDHFQIADRPQIARSSLRSRVERGRDGVQVVGEQMPVSVQSQHRGLVRPRSRCTTFTFAPALIARDAHVWRRSCSRAPSQPSTGRITFDDLVEQFKVSTFTVVPSASERAAVSRAAV
jgi:hypothetical protein